MVKVQQELRRQMSDLKVEGELLSNRLGVNWDGIVPSRAKQVWAVCDLVLYVIWCWDKDCMCEMYCDNAHVSVFVCVFEKSHV